MCYNLGMKRWLACLLGLFLIAGCIPLDEGNPPVETKTPASISTTLDWINVYFTDPDSTQAGEYRGGPDEALAAAIDRARLTVDMAIYSLNLWSIRDALLDAWQRGVRVRLVVESDNLDGEEVQELIAAGIPVLGDRHEGLMHNKFTIIDRWEVWTGSMNYTVSGAYYDHNNLVRIESSEVAEKYLAEFNEMMMDDRFGSDSPADEEATSLKVDGMPVEVLFSPEDGVAEQIIELIDEARRSIHFLAFSFTSDEITNAMMNAAQNYGVSVLGIMDESQVSSNQGTSYEIFQYAGLENLDVRLDGSDDQMHHKVIIIDERIVIVGSYNFSANAEENNDENLVILHSPKISRLYEEEFERLFVQAPAGLLEP